MIMDEEFLSVDAFVMDPEIDENKGKETNVNKYINAFYIALYSLHRK